MIRQILVGIDGSEYGETALTYGLYLAQKFQATLHAIHVVDIVQVESPLLYDLAGAIGAAPQLNLTAQMRRNLVLRGEHLLKQCRQTCEEVHVPCVEHLVTGVVPTEIMQVAQEMDLIVLGRGGLHTGLSKRLLGSTIDNVIRHSHKPTMVTTLQYYQAHKPLLATDGSPSAMGALHVAAVLAKTLGWPLQVVHCTADAGRGQGILDEAQSWLEQAGVVCTGALHVGNAHADLVAYMMDHGHDLLFMGAFGRNRVAEWVLGSTTQYLLHTCPGPMMLCHATSALSSTLVAL
jgi:nucleotide-binding universal stress UspA family protein